MSNSIIKVLGEEIRIVEWQGQRVVMTKDIAKMHEIDVYVINQKYRRNKKYFKEGYDYFEVKVNDFKSALTDCDDRIKDELFYKNTQEYILLITEAGYLNFVKTINDDKAWKIFLDLKKVYLKAKQNKELRDDTKVVRKSFTDIQKEYGYDKKHHFIQTTKQMKKELNITNKKDDMTNDELQLVMASEIIASQSIVKSNKHGYYEINPICVEVSKKVNEMLINKSENIMIK
jgi:hypothetical protein